MVIEVRVVNDLCREVLTVVFIYWGCHNKVPQMGSLK